MREKELEQGGRCGRVSGKALVLPVGVAVRALADVDGLGGEREGGRLGGWGGWRAARWECGTAGGWEGGAAGGRNSCSAPLPPRARSPRSTARRRWARGRRRRWVAAAPPVSSRAAPRAGCRSRRSAAACGAANRAFPSNEPRPRGRRRNKTRVPRGGARDTPAPPLARCCPGHQCRRSTHHPSRQPQRHLCCLPRRRGRRGPRRNCRTQSANLP